MFNSPAQAKGSGLVQRGWARLCDGLELAVMLIFTSVSLFPNQALAFSNDVELSHLNLVFVLDPSLEGMAVVGIEAFPHARTFARVLNEESLQVRSSLAEGSRVRVLSTAYSSTFDQTDGDPFITASGQRVGSGTMAANFLPLGTKVRMGDAMYIISDRMNKRFNDKYVVDIWKQSRRQALTHGARMAEMEVVSLP